MNESLVAFMIATASMCASGVSIYYAAQTGRYRKSADWHREQIALWRTDPAEAQRRKDNPPSFVARSDAKLEKDKGKGQR